MIGRLDPGRRVRVICDMNGLTRELVARGCTGRARGQVLPLGLVTCLGFFEPFIRGRRLGWVKGDAAACTRSGSSSAGCRAGGSWRWLPATPGPMGLHPPPRRLPRPAATAGGRGASAGSGQACRKRRIACSLVLRRQAPISRRSPVRPWPGAATHSSGRSGPSSAARSRAFTVSRTFSRLTLAGTKPPSAYASCRRSVRLASAKKTPRESGAFGRSAIAQILRRRATAPAPSRAMPRSARLPGSGTRPSKSKLVLPPSVLCVMSITKVIEKGLVTFT